MWLRIPLIVLLLVSVFLPGTAAARKPRAKPAPAEAPPPSPSATLIAAVQKTLGVDVRTVPAEGHLPPVLVALVRGVSGTRADQVLEEMNKHAGVFETQWQLYEVRRVEVEQIVANARALRQRGKHQEARELLESAIMPAPDRFKTDEQVRTVDAEVALIGELAEIVGAAEDYRGLVGLVPALAARRRVGAHDDELLDHVVGFTHSSLERDLAPSKYTPLAKAWRYAYNAINDITAGTEGALGYYKTLARYGLHEVAVVDLSRKAKKGSWVHFPLPVESFEGNRARLEYDADYQQGYACKNGRVIGINWFYGELVRERVCKYRPVKFHVDVEVDLTELPEWMPKRGRVVVVGRVVQGGKRVKVASAFVADLRSIHRPADSLGTITEEE